MISANIKKTFSCNIEIIWNIITDNKNYLWRSDLSKIEIIDDTHFIEYDKNNFATNFTITSKKKFEEYKFNMKNKNFIGSWIGKFKVLNDNLVELYFIEEIEVNSIIMKLFVKKYLKKQQIKYMNDLEKEIKRRIEK